MFIIDAMEWFIAAISWHPGLALLLLVGTPIQLLAGWYCDKQRN